MKSRSQTLLLALTGFGLLAIPTYGQDVSVGIHGGTQGLGLSLSTQFSENLGLRLVGGQYSTDRTISSDNVDYQGDLQIGSILALIDWYPTGGAFRVSAGMGWNDNRVNVTAPLEDLVRDQLPDLPPLSFELGTAEGTAQGEDLAPALLLGWGNSARGSRFGVSLDIGVLYQGEPTVQLEARTTPEVDAIPGAREILQALADLEETELEEELKDYSIIPVVNLGFTFRF
jgi:hypothetical protein